jgi:hypothetical protein
MRKDDSKGEMREQVGYCWQKAAEYAARAEEAPDKETRELFVRFRQAWLSAAKLYQPLRVSSVIKTTTGWRSTFTPELGTQQWYRRPTGGLASAPAERRGGT